VVPAPTLGPPLNAVPLPWRRCATRFTLVGMLAVAAAPAFAAERYALVITGASGGADYATKYQGWRTSFVQTLRDKFGYPEDHVKVLSEEGGRGEKSTREDVRAALTELRKRAVDGDISIVLLIGHGTADSEDAKFNLVGPDLTVDEWAALVEPIPGRVVFINASSGSFPFLAKLAGKGRIVLTAGDNAAQQFETVFPQFFVKAFEDGAADLDKNGKVSLLEAFTYAGAHVKEHFEERGQLATERPLLDDTGDGVGREAASPGRDGTLAQVTYLQPDVPPSMAGNPELAALMRQRAEVENKLDVLKAEKETMPADRYQAELERLLVELARLDRTIRSKT
jgi:hypothetical protein